MYYSVLNLRSKSISYQWASYIYKLNLFYLKLLDEIKYHMINEKFINQVEININFKT